MYIYILRTCGKKIPFLRQSFSSFAVFFNFHRPMKITSFVKGSTISKRLFSSNKETEDVLKNKSSQNKLRDKNTSLGLTLFAIVVGFVGLSYAAVPLYEMFCAATGYGGTVKKSKNAQDIISMKHSNPPRQITIHFNADINGKIPWKFSPIQDTLKVFPGESTLAFYRASNLAKEALSGIATYNVTPQKAGQYFNKIECFCFSEQRLEAGEEVDMPVLFVIDPSILDDPHMKDVHDITLSYTFFLSE